MSTYWEMLRDPQWQRKRLEIMARDNWRCRRCWSDKKTLNVHHGYYEKNKKPWEYPSETLHTLCEDCHKVAEQMRLKVLRIIATLHCDSDYEYVFGYAACSAMQNGTIPEVVLGGAATIGALSKARLVPEQITIANACQRQIDGKTREDPYSLEELRAAWNHSPEEYAVFNKMDEDHWARLNIEAEELTK